MLPKASDDFDGFIKLDGERVHVADAERVSQDILQHIQGA